MGSSSITVQGTYKGILSVLIPTPIGFSLNFVSLDMLKGGFTKIGDPKKDSQIVGLPYNKDPTP